MEDARPIKLLYKQVDSFTKSTTLQKMLSAYVSRISLGEWYLMNFLDFPSYVGRSMSN